MTKPRLLLVPMDGSRHSEDALKWTMDYIAKPGDTVTLFMVYAVAVVNPTAPGMTSIGPGVPEELFFSTEEYESRYHQARNKAREKCCGQLQPLIDQYAGSGVQFEVVLEEGDPREAIVEFAKKSRCDQILMATRGMGLVKRVLIGSVSDHVVHNAPCPVTVVRPRC
eukprot:comp14702_c0_seq1/m.11084 comp14702_c0_seq1/g.11084  ORF comp14702_c0_seq1/g.11084 comp14702_c0_seq1/m.11084 type:complete len:167 (-) comp14702_c0_seq1:597-1097(-)